MTDRSAFDEFVTARSSALARTAWLLTGTETALGSYDEPHAPHDSDLRLTLDAALAQLTPKQRTILVLRFFEDLTEVQTADPSVSPVSIAVDLIPDLDGTSNQQLTHDFGDPDVPGDSPWRDRAPVLLGGLLAGLAFIRMLQRQ